MRDSKGNISATLVTMFAILAAMLGACKYNHKTTFKEIPYAQVKSSDDSADKTEPMTAAEGVRKK